VTGAPAASLEVSAAYTYTNSLQRKPLVQDVIRSFAIPKQQFSVVATQRFGRRLFVNFDLTTWSENLAPIFDSRTFASRAYRFGAVASRKTIVDPDVESSLVEQYRRLAASLHHAQLQRNVRTVMITSAVAAEGKTLTATNLALTLSHSYKRRVLLIDADLRRPTVHEAFRIANDTGLVDVLRKTETRRLPLCRASETLWILTAGRATSDPMSALASEEMKLLLGEAIEHFDWVIVDSPPVALLSDANLVAAMVDATILVIGAATPYPLVRRAVESVGASRIIGTVLNRIERGQMVGGYGFYDYYGYGTRDDGARKAGKADAAREAAMDAA